MNRHHFSKLILNWWHQHGRKDMPWQQKPTPYRVWVSEIMLQQTQVATAIPYYLRFMETFPDVHTLAEATLDEVLHQWSGLGYYTRAHNLHRAAKLIVSKFNGQLIDDLAALESLPGIGRTTAGAIIAQAYNRREVILDGNVKRVISRYKGIVGWPGLSHINRQLWDAADELTPEQGCRDYTQAIMDFGATLCSRHQPQCSLCPVPQQCWAYQHQQQHKLPTSRPKKELPKRLSIMLIILDPEGKVYLQKHLGTGVWKGLYCFPQYPMQEDEPRITATKIKQHYLPLVDFDCIDADIIQVKILPPKVHKFSHYQLNFQPVIVQLNKRPALAIREETLWYDKGAPPDVGLAKPVSRLLATC